MKKKRLDFPSFFFCFFFVFYVFFLAIIGWYAKYTVFSRVLTKIIE